ncbi:hypothetical protein DFS34DRAFT_591607 [Phlyctochytrium arcticum]|nr:hypothetical protein DFS34DRAFT_591607 [Phlyctochytrium arcticum]
MPVKLSTWMHVITTLTTVNLVKNFIKETSSSIEANLEIFKTKRLPAVRRLSLITTTEEDKTLAFTHWLNMVYDALNNGKKLYIFTPFKKGNCGVDTIAQTFVKAFGWTEGSQVLTYYAEKEKEKRDLCDANQIWGNPNDINIERWAGKNNSMLQTLMLFCEHANLSILPLNVSEVVMENAAFLQKIQTEIDSSFDYNRIKDIDHDTFEKSLELIYSNRSTFDIRLQVQKYSFNKKFKFSAEEGCLSELWKKAPHNGVDLQTRNFELPENMTTSIPVSVIKKQYSLSGPVQDYKSGPVAAVLNAHFGLHLYKRKMVKNDDVWISVYKTTRDAVIYIQDCLNNLPEYFKLTVDADEDTEDEMELVWAREGDKRYFVGIVEKEVKNKK